MNDAEVIKALECCRNGDGVCEDCPSNNKRKGGKDCIDEVIREALALINGQQTEIEKLKKLQQRQADLIIEERGRRYELASQFTTSKAEAVREFAEKLKENFSNLEYDANTTRKTLPVDTVKSQMDWVLHEVTTKEIDNLVNEMFGNPEELKGEENG